MTRAPVHRLGAYDVHCLRAETPARPMQVGVLAVLDGRLLCDAGGRLRLEEIRSEIEAGLVRVPQLRRVVHRPGLLAGRPLWVDDAGFRMEHHVGQVDVPPPGDEQALLARTEQLMAGLLDSSRPLWRMWFMTGLADGRIGVLVVLHHALADGLTAMRMVRALLPRSELPSAQAPGSIPVLGAAPVPGPASVPARAAAPSSGPALAPAGVPPWCVLVLDNARSAIGALLMLVRPATWRRGAAVLGYLRQANRISRHAPATSLNAPVGPRRRLGVLRLESATTRRVARAHGCGVNDVVLTLVAGGVRALLDARGEPIARLRPRAGIAVALFSAGRGTAAGNDVGTLHVPLPLAESEPAARMLLIAAETATAKQGSMVAAEPLVRAWLARFPVVRRGMERQRLVNLSETYLPGPTAPIEVLGAPVLDLIPVAPLAGNLGLSFVALSYAGRISVAVRADADQFPDLEVLAGAMARDWRTLAGQVSPAGDRRSLPGRGVRLSGARA